MSARIGGITFTPLYFSELYPRQAILAASLKGDANTVVAVVSGHPSLAPAAHPGKASSAMADRRALQALAERFESALEAFCERFAALRAL